MQKLKKPQVPHVNKVISDVFSFYMFDLEPSTKPAEMFLLWGDPAVPVPFCVHPQ